MITVFANRVRNCFHQYDVENVVIVKNGVTMKLDQNDWNHLVDVLAGKEVVSQQKLEEGEYSPKSISLWSKKELL